MEIRKAVEKDFETVKTITQDTIKEVYPKYYPDGAVKFFSNHHSDENIRRDINNGRVYLLITDDKEMAGTVTLSNDEIDRLFVLPSYQHKGYGRMLLDFAEKEIAKSYDKIVIHASLPAKKIYLKRGFHEVEYNILDTGYGDYLCFDKMERNTYG
ncbi:MAG: GNAT family N-acetyltransferase [Clostridiales bacterium]|nr:GNAT family N-acetyltransferase [Clostridiales bacterium]